MIVRSLLTTAHKRQGPIMVQRVNTTKKSSINIYSTHDGQTEVTVQFDDQGQVWLTAKEIGVLYGKATRTVEEHIQTILKQEEFSGMATERGVVTRNFRVTSGHHRSRSGTQSKQVAHYSLDMILTVGMRVHSNEARYFRMWAREHLTHILQDGYSASSSITPSQANDMLNKATHLRSLGKVELKNLYHTLSNATNYRPNEHQPIYAIINATIVYGVTGLLPKEILLKRSDPSHPTFGIHSGAPLTMSNVLISLNYLTTEELKQYNRLLTATNLYIHTTCAERMDIYEMHDILMMVKHVIARDKYAIYTGSNNNTAGTVDINDTVLERFTQFTPSKK